MHNAGMRSHSDIIKAAGVEAVAKLTEAPILTVRSWVARNSIPAKHWATLIEHELSAPDELIAAAAKAA